jgi:hypothetical protein
MNMWRLADIDEERGIDASNHDIHFSQCVSVNGRVANPDVHPAAVLGISYAELQRKRYLWPNAGAGDHQDIYLLNCG